LRKPLHDPEVEALLLVALYQLIWSQTPAYAAVNEAVSACNLLRKPAAKGLVNAVLRGFLRQQDALLRRARETPPGRFSYPAWWIEHLQGAYPHAWREILDAGNLHPPMTLRVNSRRCTAEAYLAMLEAADIAARRVGPVAITLEHAHPVESLPHFGDGWVSVQDLAAQHAVRYLDLQEGQRVLDACAAPGGKTGHILETATVDLVAVDRDADRLRRVEANLLRLGLTASLVAADATAPEAWWDRRYFDRALLDAPCSASGVVRRHPDIKWLRRPADLDQFARLQARLLEAVWRTLAPGGKLLYATCSVFAEENSLQIAEFLRTHNNGLRLPILELAQTEGQLFPDARHDGFYYALLQKTGGTPR
jgi:16S rRNA (cytosine967-C5)-methyltransferase